LEANFHLTAVLALLCLTKRLLERIPRSLDKEIPKKTPLDFSTSEPRLHLREAIRCNDNAVFVEEKTRVGDDIQPIHGGRSDCLQPWFSGFVLDFRSHDGEEWFKLAIPSVRKKWQEIKRKGQKVGLGTTRANY
jgi:hypothetical protein